MFYQHDKLPNANVLSTFFVEIFMDELQHTNLEEFFNRIYQEK